MTTSVRRLGVALLAIALAVFGLVPTAAEAQLTSTVDFAFSNPVLDGPMSTVDPFLCGGPMQPSCSGSTDAQVEWGQGGRSSLEFFEANPTITVVDDTPVTFAVGTLRHNNEQVNFFSTISEVDFSLTLQVSDPARGVVLTASDSAPLEIFETSNVGATCEFGNTPPNCRDELILAEPQLSATADDGNVLYRVDGVRFVRPNSGPSLTVLTDEFASTDIPMRATVQKISLVDADAGPDQTVDEGSAVQLDGTGSRVTALNYTWTQISGPPVTLNSTTSPTPTFTAPELTETASVVFRLTVQDKKEPNNGDLSDSDTVRITIIDVNDPPVADAGPPYVVDEGSTIALDGTGSSDPDGTPLSYEWDFDIDGTADAFTATPVFDAALRDGPLVVPVRLTVCDDFNECDASDTTVEVRNVAPSAAISGPNVVDEGSPITISSTATDPAPADEAVLTFRWDLDSDGVYDDYTGPNPTLTPPDGPAILPVAVEVCDDDGGCDIATGAVDVLNVAPVVDAGPDITVYRNDVVNLEGSFVDPGASFDNAYVTQWSGDSPFVALASSATYGEVVPATTVYPIEGFYGVELSVTDKDGAIGTDSLVVEVLNKPPVCTAAGPSLPELWPPNHKFVAISIEGLTDPEGDPLVTTITSIFQDEPVDAQGSGPRGGVDGRGVGTAIAELKAERAGPQDSRFYHVSFSVDDGHGGQCTGTVQVVVPHDQRPNRVDVDQGPIFDSTVPA